jgi:putative nucleotidyltransferase with HDIG domain
MSVSQATARTRRPAIWPPALACLWGAAVVALLALAPIQSAPDSGWLPILVAGLLADRLTLGQSASRQGVFGAAFQVGLATLCGPAAVLGASVASLLFKRLWPPRGFDGARWRAELLPAAWTALLAAVAFWGVESTLGGHAGSLSAACAYVAIQHFGPGALSQIGLGGSSFWPEARRLPSVPQGGLFLALLPLAAANVVLVKLDAPGLVAFALLPAAAACALVEARTREEAHYYGAIAALTAMLQRAHPQTNRHMERVADAAEEVGLRLGMPRKRARLVREAALLHDIGKIAIDEQILEKPGPLTHDEMAHVKRHAEYGAEILAPVRRFGPLVAWVRHHHERPDGTGYPDGLSGSRIPLASRIIAVVDAYDAMTAGIDGGERRAYREPVGEYEAVAELKACSGKQFDPRVVRAFCSALRRRGAN